MTSSSHSSSLNTSTAQSGSSDNVVLPPHPRLQTSFPLPPTSYFLPLHPHHRLMLLAVSFYLLLPLPTGSLKVLQWNTGDLRARNTELQHFVLPHPVDLICIQTSNLNLSSSFRIPGFSALRSDCTHSRSEIFATGAHTPTVTSLFSSDIAYRSLNFLSPLFLRLIPTLLM